MSTVHVVVPDSIDDPAHPSGGNVYDRRVCDGLSALGWVVVEHHVGGPGFPGQPGKPDVVRGNPSACRPVSPDRTPATEYAGGLAEALARIPEGALVLVDGLLSSRSPEVIATQARRLRLVVLLHMPIGGGAERATLTAATAVVTTSHWTRQWVLDHHGVPPERVHVAEPGAELANLAPGTPSGGALLCVGAVTPTKGYDVLVAALAAIGDLEWRCVCAGALDLDPGYVASVLRDRDGSGLTERIDFVGPLTRGDLATAHAESDVLVSASRAETYGMAITEALARGLPVIATDVGGVTEALGQADGGQRPGLLVPTGDASALTAALRRWLTEAALRDSLRAAARTRRLDLTDWSVTTERLSRALDVVAQQNGGGL